MARAEAIAALLDGADQKTIEGVVGHIKQLINDLDANTDKRFQAFDEVVQQQLDAVEELEDKLEEVIEVIGKIEMPKPIDHTNQIKGLSSGMEDLAYRVNALGLKPTESNKSDIAALKQDVLKLKLNQDRIESMMARLLTARRVPVRDSSGNLIGVELEV
jgi:hypothetical protein